MVTFLLILLTLVLVPCLYAFFLLIYKEKDQHLKPHEEDCFSPLCASIVRKNGSEKAVLFIHGFAATPDMYLWASDYLSEKGYDIYAPLMPTCGTDCMEFVHTNCTSLFSYIDQYYQNLRKEYAAVHVVGISMGGSFALKLGEKYSGTPEEMNSLCTISAPVTYSYFHSRSRFLELVSLISMSFVPSIHPVNLTSRPERNDGDDVWCGYGGAYPQMGVSLMRFLKPVKRNLRKITAPLLAVHCTSDKTVPFWNLGMIDKGTVMKDKTIKEIEIGDEFHHSHHVLLKYNSSRERVMALLYPYLEAHNER